ncbi:winged helix-turn-helix domain-containing protein [Curtobacterium aetherium]|uniref:Response regulator transcription factor n=1 Tax=Curtobacterium aetherium TaxID=2841594 RepID=A0ACD1E840_9MICO|nr:response regulator transcription factor [Curtobacterium sp. L6-1]QWS34969.1 response regulator transcription factor [Curtobacterium sp. L6-1]
MKVLLLEDDEPLALEVERVLRRAGHAVDVTRDYQEAEIAAASGTYGCLVLDRTVPGGDGATLVAALRRRGDLTPALVVTARDALADRVSGFDLGADDYLVKPFAAVELIARVRALGRRGQVTVPPTLERAGIRLDVQRHTVHRHGTKLILRAKEFAVLDELLRASGGVVTRSDLIERCWDEHHDPASNVVDVVIAQLRKRLGSPPPIHTVRGVGYRLVDEADGDA